MLQGWGMFVQDKTADNWIELESDQEVGNLRANFSAFLVLFMAAIALIGKIVLELRFGSIKPHPSWNRDCLRRWPSCCNCIWQFQTTNLTHISNLAVKKPIQIIEILHHVTQLSQLPHCKTNRYWNT